MPAGVTDTAAAIARVRAEEATLPFAERLFDDSFAALFVPRDAAATVSEQFLSVPFFREQVRLRTRFFDDFVREGIQAGIRQLVILGAGFDCRALRLPSIAESGCRVYEVDLPEQLEAKRGILAAAGVGLPESVRHAACDLSAPGWEDRLAAALAEGGFRSDRGARLLLEGVVAYLGTEEVRRLFAWMARAAADAAVGFNYHLGRAGPATMEALVREAGFRTVASHRCDALHRRHLAGEPPPGGDLFYVAVATL